MSNLEASLKQLPEYLQKYAAVQNYEKYTPVEQASWRLIMRRSQYFFKLHGLPIYEEGLKLTGISADEIPRISDMHDALQKWGWSAVPVCGFIPPAAFLEFQSLKFLPIATDMRTLNHLSYTPAPDIVHEAAGHAPILADKDFRDYLAHYAFAATRAIISSEDIAVYEAIRLLSDLKENPDASTAEIKSAQTALTAASKNLTYVSESSKVARMAWWTVEYGLMGSLDEPKIFGAGLLSSVGESAYCLSTRVKRLPLTIACVDQGYDITEPQPQLFVARNIPHMLEVLKEFEQTLSYQHGGVGGLSEAKKAKSVNTVRLENAVEISGILENYQASGKDVEFLKFSGPVQISLDSKQLSGHGSDYHAQGYSCPVGRWKNFPNLSPSALSCENITQQNIFKGGDACIDFVSGFQISGEVRHLEFLNGKLLWITFANCTVKQDDKIFYDPSWGLFDYFPGEKITSVFGGPADKASFGDYDIGVAQSVPGRQSVFSMAEQENFKMLTAVKNLRINLQKNPEDKASHKIFHELLEENLGSDKFIWITMLELYELGLMFFEHEKTQFEPLKKRILDSSILIGEGERDLVVHSLNMLSSLT